MMNKEQMKRFKKITREQDKIKAELRRIDATREPVEGTGAIIAHKQRGYLSGMPYLWSTNYNNAFLFKNKEVAEKLIKKFKLEATAIDL